MEPLSYSRHRISISQTDCDDSTNDPKQIVRLNSDINPSPEDKPLVRKSHSRQSPFQSKVPLMKNSSSSQKPHRPLSPSINEDEPQDQPLPGLDDELGESEPDVTVDRLRNRDKRDIMKHRMTGHATYNPNCVHCVSSKGITKHPRNPNANQPHIQADFGFVGEEKFLVLWESVSRARAFVHIRSNLDIVVTEVRNWVKMIGLYSDTSTFRCYLKCDAEASLATLLEKCVIAAIERSAPQSPETTGGAERSVRYLKEGIACLKSDFLENGINLKVNSHSAPFIGRYLAMTYNGYHAVEGSKMTPLELVIGQSRQPVLTTMLGAMCYAEVPDSVEVPAATRFTPACFLGPEYGSKSPLVVAATGSPDNIVMKIFKAKSVKILNQVSFEVGYCPWLLERLDNPDSQLAIADRPEDGVVKHDKQSFTYPMPKTGPPKTRLIEFGRTPNCNACSYDKLHGRVHNKKCKARYLKWQQEQRNKSENPEVIALTNPPSSVIQPGRLVQPSTAAGSGQPALPPTSPDVVPGFSHDEADKSEDEGYHYSRSEAPSLYGDDDDGPVSMEIDKLSYVETAENFVLPDDIEMFSQMFSDTPEEHFERIGCLNSFYGSQSLLSPFYLPKIGEPTEFSEFSLNGSKVYLAYPKQVRSEGSLEQLNVEKAVKARIVELSALDKAKFGNIIGKQEAESFAKKHNLKIIGTRWVVGPKEIENADGKIEEAVRARLVVQEVASTNDAAYLGYSSSTPSGEAIRALLSHISSSRWHVATLDVGTAFMNAGLPPGVRAVVRLPSDISIDPNEHKPCYATLNRALNGLRCASRAWLSLASEICVSHGLKQCASESCVFMGQFTRGNFTSEVALVIYVDDVLVGCDNKDAIDEIRLAFLSRVEKIKVTGHLPLHQDGRVKFLGREIIRQKGSDDLLMRVPCDYLQEICRDLTPTNTYTPKT